MALTEEGRNLKNAYLREWARKNRERKKANDDAYWNRKAEKALKEQAAKEGGQDE